MKAIPFDPTDEDTLFIGLLRLHIANLIKPLGHAELAGALQRLTHQPFARRLQDDLKLARTLLDAAPVGEPEKASSMGGLVGGIVTRAGPVTGADVAPVDQESLARLHLRPVFVGIERDLIRAAIDAEPQAVRNRIADTVSPDEFAWYACAGTANQRSVRAKRCKKGLRRAFRTTVKFTSTTTFPRRQLLYWRHPRENKEGNARRDRIRWDGVHRYVHLEIGGGSKAHRSRLGPVRWIIKNR
jgi:hypothetical protein